MSAIAEPFLDHTTFETYHPRTQVLRGCAKGVRWELWLRSPRAAFTGMIKGFWAGDADTVESRHRQLPSGELWLMFNLGPPQRISPVDGGARQRTICTASIVGLQDGPLIVESMIRNPCVVVVRFLPPGAWAFFRGLPLEELANQSHDLDAVLGSAAGVEPLRQRLLHRVHLGEALDLLEEWVMARLAGGPGAHPAIRHSLHHMAAECGTLRVEHLASEVGVSPRYLNDLFRRETGLPLKSLIRISRFERAQDLLIAYGDRNLAGLAHECGYYDQSHLNRDFRELADLTPREYLARVFVLPGWREIGG